MKSFMVIFILFISCTTKDQVDLIVFNGKVYTVDSLFSIQEAFAVKNGKFVAAGSNEDILSNYRSADQIDLKEQVVYPGFIDAHCHFYGYGLQLSRVNLVGTKSYEEVVARIQEHIQKFPDLLWIQGRGWDQNDWETKDFPDRAILDSLFPDKAIYVRRIDGHAALINKKTIELASITNKSFWYGGSYVLRDGSYSDHFEELEDFRGILIDNTARAIAALCMQ